MRSPGFLLLSMMVTTTAMAQSTVPAAPAPTNDPDVIVIGYEGRGDYNKSRLADLERQRKKASMPEKKLPPAYEDEPAPANAEAKTPPMAAGLAAALGTSKAIAQITAGADTDASASAPTPAPAPAPVATPVPVNVQPRNTPTPPPSLRTDSMLGGDAKLLPKPAITPAPSVSSRPPVGMNPALRRNAMPLLPSSR